MEQQYHQKTAERLALVSKWKQAQIQEKLNKALGSISMDGSNEAFERAATRISELDAKSSARLELAQGGLQQQLDKLQVSEANTKADAELMKMKAELGMLPEQASTTETEQPTQTVRNIEV